MVEIFCERLIKVRKQKQLTQKAAAALIGVQASSLSAYEGGRKTPSIEIVMQIAHAYGVSIDWLVGNVDGNGNVTDDGVLLKIDTKGKFIRALSSLCMCPLKFEAKTDYGDNSVEYAHLPWVEITFFMNKFDETWLPIYMDRFTQIADVVKNAGLDKDVLDAWVAKQIKEVKDISLIGNCTIVDDDELPF